MQREWGVTKEYISALPNINLTPLFSLNKTYKGRLNGWTEGYQFKCFKVPKKD